MVIRNEIGILLIEDNKADVELIRLMLKEASVKHHFYTCDTLFEAMEIPFKHQIDIALLDLSINDSSGFKTLNSYIDSNPSIPVIVLTGQNNEIVGNQSVKAGAQDFLVKGQFDGKLLGRSIRYSLQRFQTQTKLEETAKNLAYSEKRFLEAQEMAHIGNWEMDLVSNSMKWTNEVFKIFGYKPMAINPGLSNYLEFVHLDDRPAVEVFFDKISKSYNLESIEHRVVIGTNIKYVYNQARLQADAETGNVHIVGILQDITDRKVSEKLIIEKNITDNSSKIKEEALADISFHIRTPLFAAMNLVYLMENSKINSAQDELIDGVKTSLEDLNIMIGNLLNFSILMSENLKVEDEEINTREFFNAFEKLIHIRLQGKMLPNFQLQIESSLPERMITDSKKLNLALYNLVEYISKKQGKSSKAILQINYHDIGLETPTLQIRLVSFGDIIEVEESMAVLQSEDLVKMYFDPESIDAKQKIRMHTAIMAKLVNILEGKWSLEHTKESPNVFNLDIPVKRSKTITLKMGEKPNIPIRILLVEDHYLNQLSTKKILTSWSNYISVDIAENGRIGVEKHIAHQYDLILMDIQMPEMDGIMATRKIRERSSVPIIALTANSNKIEASKVEDAGANDYLAKPFKPQDLFSKIMSQFVLKA
jgi:PAS domain S-box-containing protein